MEGIPGFQNFDYQRFYGAGQDLSNLDEEEAAKLQEQKMKWIMSSAEVPQGQQPGAVKGAPGATPKAAGGGGAAGDAGAAGAAGAADTTGGANAAGGAGAAGAAAGGGEPIINKNGTRMNAEEVSTISDIFKKAGKSGMKAEELAAKLKERGIEATATKINGKMALKFANGDTFVDTSANGVLDTDDKEWTEAVKALKGKYGDNAPQLKGGAPIAGADQGNAANAVNNNGAAQAVNAAGNTPQAANNLMSPQLPNPAYQGPRGIGGDNQDPQQLKNVLSELDNTLGEKGYKGCKCEELLKSGELELTLAKYGVAMPAVPQQNNGTGDYVNNLFRNALMLSAIK